MKKISVILDAATERALFNLKSSTGSAISDIVNVAIISLEASGYRNEHEMPEQCLMRQILDKVIESKWRTLENWCEAKSINKISFKRFIKRVSSGSVIYGRGSKNKWREKEDGRLFKTHTSWMAHCLEEDFNIAL